MPPWHNAPALCDLITEPRGRSGYTVPTETGEVYHEHPKKTSKSSGGPDRLRGLRLAAFLELGLGLMWFGDHFVLKMDSAQLTRELKQYQNRLQQEHR